MEITLRLPYQKTSLRVSIEKLSVSRKENILPEELKSQILLAEIEKERDNAINKASYFFR